MQKVYILLAMISFLCACKSERETILERIPAEHYETLMSMSYDEFDQTPNGGWRQFYGDPELQILLISDYIDRNDARQQSLRWHLGQLHAMNDDYPSAISYFEQCIFKDTSASPLKKAWNYYVHGTIAFVTKEEEKLDAYIDSLQNNEDSMNLEVLMGLKDNFEKPYKEAYSSN